MATSCHHSHPPKLLLRISQQASLPRKPRPHIVIPKMASIFGYAQREWATLLSAKPLAVAYGPYSTVKGWDKGVPPTEDAVRVYLLLSAPFWLGSRPLLSSKRVRVMSSFLDCCYASATQVAQMANYMAFHAGSLDCLTHQRTMLIAPEITEMHPPPHIPGVRCRRLPHHKGSDVAIK
eukprot:superscaffoldBa00000010_g224